MKLGSGNPRARDSKDLTNFGQEKDTELPKIQAFNLITNGAEKTLQHAQHTCALALCVIATQSLP